MSDLMIQADPRDAGQQPQPRSTRIPGRRGFLTAFALTGAAAGLTTLTGCSSDGPVAVPGTTPSVTDVLNFSLNLEYLEASFYSYITTGSGLPAADMGGSPGSVSGGAKVTFTNPIIASLANQIARDEREHVELLRSTITSLGGTPVDMPAINLAAMGAVTNDATFLAAARQLEGVGVSAYAGGSQYLVSNPNVLTNAAQILHAEAQHAAFLRELCIVNGVASPAADAQDLPPTSTKVFNTDPNTGLNPVRTTSQVLQIVYASPGTLGVSKGGFFPNGLNGAIAIS